MSTEYSVCVPLVCAGSPEPDALLCIQREYIYWEGQMKGRKGDGERERVKEVQRETKY